MHPKWCIVQLNVLNGGVENGRTNEAEPGGNRITGISEGWTESRTEYGTGTQGRRKNSGRNTRIPSMFCVVEKADKQKLHNNGVTDNEFWDSSSKPELNDAPKMVYCSTRLLNEKFDYIAEGVKPIDDVTYNQAWRWALDDIDDVDNIGELQHGIMQGLANRGYIKYEQRTINGKSKG